MIPAIDITVNPSGNHIASLIGGALAVNKL
jgi:hypothetical protein